MPSCPRCSYYLETAFPNEPEGSPDMLAYDAAAPSAHPLCRECARQRLHHAAPDMLEALRAILAEAQAYKDKPLPVYAYAWDKVHAAIAKAEGHA
jgi:hypothetical protein